MFPRKAGRQHEEGAGWGHCPAAAAAGAKAGKGRLRQSRRRTAGLRLQQTEAP